MLLKHHSCEEGSKGLRLRIFIWGSTKLLPAPGAALRNTGLVGGVQRAQEGEVIMMPSAKDLCRTAASGSDLSPDTSQ